MRRVFSFVLTLVAALVWVIPSASPDRGLALAQTAGGGISVTGDFKGAGYSQIATVYDPTDAFGLRVLVLDGNTAPVNGVTPAAPTFAATEWFSSTPGSFELGRMRIAATDANFDRKADLVALYDDGGTSVRLIVFLSTGSSFTYSGAWWSSNGYAWSRTKAILAGNFSAIGNNGLLFVYQYDNFDMRIHYLESDGKQFIYGGNQGVYASGPGQYDTARARFAVGKFTRTSGPDQVASIYQYPNFQIKVHVWEPTPVGLQPINGWGGVWASAEGTYDLSKAKIAATDVDGDKLTDLLGFYWYGDGSSRIHLFSAARSLAFIDPSGIAQFPAATLSWLETRVVAGDWNKDGKGDLATLTSSVDGTTHVGTLRSSGAALAWTADSYVAPASATTARRCTGCWPLTGMPTGGSPTVLRRTLAVKIDNGPAARPHYGISQADMVVELLVEGFITRLAAFFHSQDVGTIGAVRSVRYSDRYTTPMVRGVLVASGASQSTSDLVYRDLAAGNYVIVSPQFGEGAAFHRTNVDGRVAPYNLFTSGQALRDAANNVGGGAPVTIPVWDFFAVPSHVPVAGGFMGSVGASVIEIPYRADARVRYNWDPGTNTYARFQSNGRVFIREVDAANNAVIAAKNVVIIQTEIFPTPVIEDAGGSPSYDMRLVGGGPASVFRDGRRQDGAWYRASWFDPFIFVSNGGERIFLSPGQTWMHIVPTEWTIPSQ